MKQLPSQPDIDRVAHYVQAVADLRASPFFIDGQTNLGVSYSVQSDGTRGPMEFRVPDPRVRNSLIVPFRLMWMADEPAYFNRVANIIKRYAPAMRTYVDWFKHNLKDARASFGPARFLGFLGEPDVDISPEDVIDLWLNCRLAHVGGKARVGRFSRADFDRELHRFGNARFEYLFMTAVQRVGFCFINLAQFADYLLEKWASDGLNPSFDFDNISATGVHASDTGDSLLRRTPGVTVDSNDLPTKLALLRLQKPYSGIIECRA